MNKKFFSSIRVLFPILLLVSVLLPTQAAQAYQNESLQITPAQSTWGEGTGNLTLSGGIKIQNWYPMCPMLFTSGEFATHYFGVYPNKINSMTVEIRRVSDWNLEWAKPLTSGVDYTQTRYGGEYFCDPSSGQGAESFYINETYFRSNDFYIYGVDVPLGLYAPGDYELVLVVDASPQALSTSCDDYYWDFNNGYDPGPPYIAPSGLTNCSGATYNLDINGGSTGGSFGFPFTITPGPVCAINSFSADSTFLPASNSGTTLRVDVSGDFAWDIAVVGGSVTPSPSSGRDDSTSDTGSLPATHTYRLTCGTETAPDVTVVVDALVPVPGAATPDLKVSTWPGVVNSDGPVTVYADAPYTLSWGPVANAVSCSLSGVGGVFVSGGSQSGTMAGVSQTFTLTCLNSSGQPGSDVVDIIVPPPPTGLSGVCDSFGTTATMSWTAPAGYTNFYIRAVNNSSPGALLYPPTSEDFAGTSTSFTTTVGNTYHGWIHSRAANGAYSNAVGTSPDITCTGVPPTTMSGTLSGSSCQIALGGSSCSTSLSWGIDNPEATPTAITASGMANINVTNTLATPQSGTQSVTIPYPNRTFFLYNNAKSLVPTSPAGSGLLLSASCIAPGQWDASQGKCVVNGACGGAKNSCAVGSIQDVPDDSSNYLWNCLGSHGGGDASCSYAKPAGPIVNVDKPVKTPDECTTLNGSCPAGTISATLDGVALSAPFTSITKTICDGVTTTHTLTCCSSPSTCTTANATVTVRKQPIFQEN